MCASTQTPGQHGHRQAPDRAHSPSRVFAKDTYATLYRPTAQLQEREADAPGAAIFFATGYAAQRALGIFDKLAPIESRGADAPAESHDPASVCKRMVAEVPEDLKQLHARRRPWQP